MKSLLFKLFCVVALFCNFRMYAADIEADGIYYYILSENTVGVAANYDMPYSGDISIPEEVDDGYGSTYTVVSICGAAFANCEDLLSVIIPETVTDIEEAAFAGCTGLTLIDIPHSVTTIESSAFSSCTGLTSIEIPYSVRELAEDTFAGCTNLADINVDSENGVFASVDGVLYSKNISAIYCMPAGKHLVEFVIPESVTTIGNMAFYDCGSIERLTILDGVTTIGEWAFGGCSGLKSLALPHNLASIGNWAFERCTGLTSITIPSRVTSIGQNIVFECANLAEINVDSENRMYASVDGVLYSKDISTLCQYPMGKKQSSFEIPESVNAIYDYAFYHTNLEQVTMRYGVKSIGNNAFQYSTLEQITMPDGLETIGENAFLGCTNLKTVDIPNSVSSIGSNAFSASGLATVKIPDNLTTIEMSTFSNCKDLASVTLCDNLVTIGSGAFIDCESLTSIEIPDKVTVIGNTAFYGCSNLSSVTIGESVTSITGMSFYLCDNIKTVYCKPTVPPIVGSRVFTTVVFENAELCVPTGSADEYRLADEWRNFLNISEMDFGGIADLSGDNVTATAINGNIVINCNYETSVQVYKISGQLIYNGTDSVIAGLANGIYIVKVAGQTFKVAL